MICGGLVMYPIGWDNREVRESCGRSANVYNLGKYSKPSCNLNDRFNGAPLDVDDDDYDESSHSNDDIQVTVWSVGLNVPQTAA